MKKRIKYRVTSAFADLLPGEIINAILVAKDDNSGYGLVYHPAAPTECSSMEFCKPDKNNIWTSLNNSYLNLPDGSDQKFFGKDFKWKRIIYETPTKNNF